MYLNLDETEREMVKRRMPYLGSILTTELASSAHPTKRWSLGSA